MQIDRHVLLSLQVTTSENYSEGMGVYVHGHMDMCASVRVHVCSRVCGGQRSTQGIFLNYSHLSFETESCIEPGAH